PGAAPGTNDSHDPPTARARRPAVRGMAQQAGQDEVLRLARLLDRSLGFSSAAEALSLARRPVGRTSRSVLEGLRPAEFHEKRVWWQNGKAARRGRQGSGEVEAVGLFDPEHARFER